LRMKDPKDITINGVQLSDILELHKKWLSANEGGIRADLIRADLIRANLRGANLSDVNLSDVNLSGADLRGADLSDANLIRANLSGADLRDANLSGANLIRADLSDANLSDANLRGANLIRANLRGANLSDVNLSDADLSGANLRGANLIRANLRGANLSDAENIGYAAAVTSILPDGRLIGYKKANCKSGNVLLTIEIPVKAKRSNATGRKCRCEYAILKAVTGIGWEYDGSPVVSQFDHSFIYPGVGEKIIPDKWDDNRWNECSNGVHFFITRYEAENY
jgi:uncharacterized protein YjbI with pentapeptide repeats